MVLERLTYSFRTCRSSEIEPTVQSMVHHLARFLRRLLRHIPRCSHFLVVVVQRYRYNIQYVIASYENRSQMTGKLLVNVFIAFLQLNIHVFVGTMQNAEVLHSPF